MLFAETSELLTKGRGRHDGFGHRAVTARVPDIGEARLDEFAGVPRVAEVADRDDDRVADDDLILCDAKAGGQSDGGDDVNRAKHDFLLLAGLLNHTNDSRSRQHQQRVCEAERGVDP